MTQRATFAFDLATIHRLKKLALRWDVSQAEVIRHALIQAEENASKIKEDPIVMLKMLHDSGGGLSKEKADAYHERVYQGRNEWRRE